MDHYQVKITEHPYGGPTKVEVVDYETRGYAYMFVETRLTEHTVWEAVEWCAAQLETPKRVESEA